jgi:CDP-glycerol glycerophosphotransferase (TagB/SpsB family)
MLNNEWFTANQKNEISVFHKLFLCLVIMFGSFYGLFLSFFGKRVSIWLIGENRGDCVCDNGYFFYKHCKNKYFDRKIYFVINMNSPVFSEFVNEGDNVLIYGSIQHAFIFSLSSVSFYTHTYSDIIYRRLYELFGVNKKLVYLHHGVLGFKKFDDFYLRKSKAVDVFIIGNNLEYQILHNDVGIAVNKIKLTGYARYDYLVDTSKCTDLKIVYIPTFRDWVLDDFYSSSFFKNILSLINNKELGDFLSENSIIFNVYLHKYIQDFTDGIRSGCENIKIQKLGTTSPTQLIAESHLMITDYSSVSWDFYYLGKPVLFYRFDCEEYSKLRGSYIPLDRENIGEIVCSELELVKKIEEYYNNNFQSNSKFLDFRKSILPVLDKNNCTRIYEEAKSVEERC